MLNLKNIRKTMSVLCAAACMLWTVPFASSADVNYTHTATDYSTISAYASQNLILGKLPFEYYNYDGLGDSGWKTALTDGAETHKDCWVSDGSAIIYRLDGLHNITGFGLWGGNSGLPESFKIYVGQTVAQVKGNIAAGTDVYAWDSADDTSVNSHLINYNDGAELTDVLYVALQCTASNNGRYSEFAVFGAASETALTTLGSDSSLTQTSISSLAGENLLSGLKPFSFVNCKGYGEGPASGQYQQLSALTDGAKAAMNDLYLDSETSAAYIYRLSSPMDISGAALWGANANIPVSYNVYLGSSADVLTSGTLAFSWDASANTGSYCQYAYLDPTAYTNVLYVGFEFANCSSKIVRVDELAVFGTASTGEFVDTSLKKDSISKLADGNLLRGLTPCGYYNYNGLPSETIPTLTDGTDAIGAQSNDLWIGEKTGGIIYKLPFASNITSVALWDQHNTMPNSYDVYVGQKSDVFESGTKVFSWDASANKSSIGQMCCFGEAKENVLYVGYLFHCEAGCGGIARISELAVFGSEADCVIEDLTVTNAAIAANHSNSLIGGKLPMAAYTDNGAALNDIGGYKNVTTVSGGSNWNTVLTDGVTAGGASHADIYNAQNVKLVYQLDKVSEITGFEMWQNNISGSNFQTSYEVYVGDAPDTIFGTAPVYTYNVGDESKPMGQSAAFSGAYRRTGSYVAIRFLSTVTDGTARISEIAFYGNATEASTGPKVATLSSARITVSDSLISGKTPVDKDITSGDVSILTDGNTVNCDFAGNYVTYQLDAVSSISRFSFVSGNTGLTVGYEVYISDSLSSLYDTANKVFTWKRAYQPISLTQTVTFEEGSLPEGKYIGVKFTEKPGYNTARIMEISVEGTALTLPGDLTGNGVVDILDLIRFKKAAAGYDVTFDYDAADVDQNGEVEPSVDMVALRKILLGF